MRAVEHFVTPVLGWLLVVFSLSREGLGVVSASRHLSLPVAPRLTYLLAG